jgi:hypothetical protein
MAPRRVNRSFNVKLSLKIFRLVRLVTAFVGLYIMEVLPRAKRPCRPRLPSSIVKKSTPKNTGPAARI